MGHRIDRFVVKVLYNDVVFIVCLDIPPMGSWFATLNYSNFCSLPIPAFISVGRKLSNTVWLTTAIDCFAVLMQVPASGL